MTDDAKFILNDDWPCEWGLPVKRKKPTGKSKEDYGVIAFCDRTTVLITNIFDFDPNAEKIKYDSVNQLVEEWLVD